MGVDVWQILSWPKNMLSWVMVALNGVYSRVQELMMPRMEKSDVNLLTLRLCEWKSGNAIGIQSKFNKETLPSTCNEKNLVLFLDDKGFVVGIYVQNKHLASFFRTNTKLPVYTSVEEINPLSIVLLETQKLPLTGAQVDWIKEKIDTFLKNDDISSSRFPNFLALEATKRYYYGNLIVPENIEEFERYYNIEASVLESERWFHK